MKTDIILSGVGGQGILSIAAVIGTAAIESGLHVKQAEVHGMSQRGGAVQSHLRISDKPIHSDLIPEGECDIILSVEPMESLRYLPFLSKQGWVITNSTPCINISNYPEQEAIYGKIKELKNSVLLDADSIAAKVGTKKISNIVMLGAASGFLGLDIESLRKSISALFGRKGDEIVQMNFQALEAGQNEVKNQMNI
jgi:indolepyruvate ferredoxin oxidoreductase, beta subunit